MDLDYFICLKHNVSVEVRDKSHKDCSLLGMLFDDTVGVKKKIVNNVVSKSLVDKFKETKNIEKYNKAKLNKKRKKELEQKRFEKQIPDESIIANLEVL